jgi:hypothetical protein
MLIDENFMASIEGLMFEVWLDNNSSLKYNGWGVEKFVANGKYLDLNNKAHRDYLMSEYNRFKLSLIKK